MKNKVGDNVPAPAEMDILQKQQQGVVDELKAFCITLSREERKELSYARKEADPQVMRVRDLATKYNIDIPDMALEDMMKDLDLRVRIHPITDLLRNGLAMAEDTEREAESEMWQVFLAYYGVLCSMSKSIPELEEALKPVRKFMANRKRRQPQT